MPKRALIEKRPWLVASIAAAIAFYALRASSLPDLWLIPLKGAAVALLALYALMHGASRDARWLAGMMAIAAIGDMVLELDLAGGAMLFFCYHAMALTLYLKHPREHASSTQKAAAVAMLVLTPFLFWLLPADRSLAWPAGLYGLALGGMAACAWMSGFPRYRVGLGAALLLTSHLLIVAGSGPLASSPLPQWLGWPLDYLGQFLITVGMVQTLRRSGHAASRPA